MATEFPQRARREDRFGHMIVQNMLYFLRDQFDAFMGKQSRGSATITAGNTSVIVGFSGAGATYSVVASPTSDPGAGVRWWISSKSSGTFTIALSAAAGGNIGFDWIVKGA